VKRSLATGRLTIRPSWQKKKKTSISQLKRLIPPRRGRRRPHPRLDGFWEQRQGAPLSTGPSTDAGGKKRDQNKNYRENQLSYLMARMGHTAKESLHRLTDANRSRPTRAKKKWRHRPKHETANNKPANNPISPWHGSTQARKMGRGRALETTASLHAIKLSSAGLEKTHWRVSETDQPTGHARPPRKTVKPGKSRRTACCQISKRARGDMPAANSRRETPKNDARRASSSPSTHHKQKKKRHTNTNRRPNSDHMTLNEKERRKNIPQQPPICHGRNRQAGGRVTGEPWGARPYIRMK